MMICAKEISMAKKNVVKWREDEKKGAVIHQNGWEWEININQWNFFFFAFTHNIPSAFAFYCNVTICRFNFDVVVGFILCSFFSIFFCHSRFLSTRENKMFIFIQYLLTITLAYLQLEQKQTIKIQFTTHETTEINSSDWLCFGTCHIRNFSFFSQIVFIFHFLCAHFNTYLVLEIIFFRNEVVKWFAVAIILFIWHLWQGMALMELVFSEITMWYIANKTKRLTIDLSSYRRLS